MYYTGTLWIAGKGGLARELASYAARNHADVRCVDSRDAVGPLVAREARYLIGVGGPHNRKNIAESWAPALGCEPAQLLLAGWCGARVALGAGTILAPGTTLTTDIVLGRHVLVNINATIGHDCVVGDYSEICPGAHLSGNVVLGEGVFVGTGAVVLPGVRIGAWATVGAGAVVTRDVEPDATVVGVPACRK